MSASEPNSARRLYVGNIDYRMPLQMLEVLFAPFGVLEDVYLPQPKVDDGMSLNRGFGFVTFKAAAAAHSARQSLNGSTEPTFKRRLIVQPANIRPDEQH